MKDSQKNSASNYELLDKIQQLEKRVSILEGETQSSRLVEFKRRPVSKEDASVSESPISSQSHKNDRLESKLGEYGMAWLGNIVLLFGILFLIQFLHRSDRQVLSVVFGFVSVGGIYLVGFYTKRSIPYMSQLFKYNGHILLYFISMRIHILPGSQITENAFIGYGIVLLVIIALIYLGFKNKSQVLTVIVWIMAVVTAIASNSTHLMLALMVGVVMTSIFFASRIGWWIPLIISIVLVYFTFLMWIMGNPFATGSFEIISDHQFGYIYLFTCALSYSFLAMLPKSDGVPEPFMRAAIILNGIGFSFILTLSVLAFFSDNYFIYFGLIAAFSMGYSILLQIRGAWKTIAAMYAIYSFVSLSISIAGIYNFPLAFFLLSIQSLLVISMALWFRSRFIMIMNSLLFVGLLIAYLATAESLMSINFSFAIVAIITARILNWKKKRLEIRTERIRNIYLFMGSVMILYSLQKAVPAQFVTLSWVITALVFFVLSVLIHNIKYRWLAIITLIVTVFYLFIVDLQNISLGYRIVALLFISIISLGISIFYTRRLKHKEGEHDPGDTGSTERHHD